METQNFNSEEFATLIKLLQRIDPHKPLGTELYDAIAKVSLSIAIEALTLRRGKNGIEIFLTKRSEKEAYPGMWHSPGTIRRPGEELDDAFLRLETREFKNKLNSKKFVKFSDCPNEERGHFFLLLYLCCIDNDNSDNWFPFDNLPEPMVDHHKDYLIPEAVKAFKLQEK